MNKLRHFKRRLRRGQPRFYPDHEYIKQAIQAFLKNNGEITKIDSKDSYQLANHLTPKNPQHFLNAGGSPRKR